MSKQLKTLLPPRALFSSSLLAKIILLLLPFNILVHLMLHQLTVFIIFFPFLVIAK